jgi:GNAT superfamily N-acetyltransferase
MSEVLIRPVFPADHAAISDLLHAAYARQMRSAYPETLTRAALPLLTRPVPSLLFGGRYVLAEAGDEVLGIAGWSDISPFGRTCPPGQAHLRHLAVAPAWQGRGMGRLLMAHLVAMADRAGVRHLHCLCPLNAVPFCRATGFDMLGEVFLSLSPDVSLPAAQMRRDLGPKPVHCPLPIEAGATL